MAEAQFSWLKLASFLGALVLVVLAVVVISLGINLITDSKVFYGAASIASGVVCAVNAVLVYNNYQKKSLENR